MEAEELRRKYVDKITTGLRDYHEKNYPEDYYSGDGSHAYLPRIAEVRPTYPRNTDNYFERHGTEDLSTVQKVRGGLNFVVDKVGDALGQDYSGFLNPGVAAGGGR